MKNVDSRPLTSARVNSPVHRMLQLIGVVITIVFTAGLVSGCTMLSDVFRSQNIDPGRVGFYENHPVEGKVVTDNVVARRVSNPGDFVFVYRIDSDTVVLGKGNTDPEAKIRPLDETEKGVSITPDGARRLASYLGKVIAQYETSEKADSRYMDFQYLANETVRDIITEENVDAEYILVRFQYFFNEMGEEDEEKTLFYLAANGAASPKEISYEDIKTLFENLQKN